MQNARPACRPHHRTTRSGTEWSEAVRRRGGADLVHLGHDRTTQAGSAHPRRGPDLLDNVIGSMKRKPPEQSRYKQSRHRRRSSSDAEPHPGVDVAVGGDLPGSVRVPGRRPDRRPPAFDTAAFADAIRRFEIRSTVLPPAAMTMLCDDESIDDPGTAASSSDRSPSPLSPLQARRFRDRFGIAVLNGWGQTEMGGEIVGWTAADSRRVRRHQARLGGAPPPRRVDPLIDPDGDDTGPDEPGELVVVTPVHRVRHRSRRCDRPAHR